MLTFSLFSWPIMGPYVAPLILVYSPTVRRSRHCLLHHIADNVCCVKKRTLSTISHGRHCLLCHTADNVCWITQQTLSVVRHSRHCCFTQQTFLLCHPAEIVCCVTQANSEAGTPSNKLSDCLPLMAEVSARVQGF